MRIRTREEKTRTAMAIEAKDLLNAFVSKHIGFIPDNEDERVTYEVLQSEILRRLELCDKIVKTVFESER